MVFIRAFFPGQSRGASLTHATQIRYEVATKFCGRGSSQHEELYYRVSALGRVITTAYPGLGWRYSVTLDGYFLSSLTRACKSVVYGCGRIGMSQRRRAV